MTVLDVVETYQLDNLREHFQDPESNAAKRLEDLGMELRRMQQIG